jgi:predicted permease
MSWLNRIFRRRKLYSDLAEEMREHLDEKTEQFLRDGMIREEAEHAARRAFGNPALLEQRSREVWQWPMLESLWADVKYALLQFQKSPGFASVVIITLALGIGVNTALFSIVDTVLLNPLALPQSGELVSVDAGKPNFEHGPISYPNFLDWQRENHSFAGFAMFSHAGFLLTGSGENERVRGNYVSSNLFSVLGVKPLLGRLFAPGEDEPGRAPIVLVTEGFWARKLGYRPDVIGHMLTFDNRDFTIVGVIPSSFDLDFHNFETQDIYVPIGQWLTPYLNNRSAGLAIHGVARLRPGVTLAQAHADMDAITSNLAAIYPEYDRGVRATLTPLRQAVVGGVQPILLVLLGAVGFVLLIACVNVANLLFARSTTRAQEFAVRLALGASRTRVIRQLLTESILLALAGGALGLLLAAGAIRFALGLIPATLPRQSHIHLNPVVLCFTFLVSVLVGIFFGLLPAFRISSMQPHNTLKEAGRGFTGTRRRAQDLLVVLEMAAALVLLTGAGLMVRSLVALSQISPGFQPDGVLMFSLNAGYSPAIATPDAMRAYLRDVRQHILSVPGVKAVSMIDGNIPMTGDDDEEFFWLQNERRPANVSDMHMALRYIVEPDYLKIMRIPLLRGRFLTDADRYDAPPVVVIDDNLARKYFGDTDPVGKQLNTDFGGGKATIVA